MRRETRQPRPDFVEKIEHHGLLYHTLEGKPYWFEEAAYVFEEREISELESATNTLSDLCLEAVEHVVSKRDFDRFAIKPPVAEVICQAWEDDPPAIYGRFDLSYDGKSPPKLLEYNADTPTSLLEAAVIQWHWLQDLSPETDQFNFIWEALVQKWKALRGEGFFPSNTVHFASMDYAEDLMTAAVMMDTAHEAGINGVEILMPDICWHDEDRVFLDQSGNQIKSIFKLYPWEFMVKEEFGEFALETYRQVNWIEPIWKMILSNKAILPLLWELFPGHPNLLPSYQDSPRDMTSYVKKARLGREGENVSIVSDDLNFEVDGSYADSGFIYQQYAPLPQFEGNFAVIGSWVVDCQACGIGIRESNEPITQDTARFVPHYFEKAI